MYPENVIQKPKFSRKKLALIIVASVLFPPLLSILLVAFVVQPVRNEGTGMLPTIRNGDKILLRKSVATLNRGDIVVLHYPPNPSQSFIKRIVGLPNETLSIDANGKLIINGSPVDEPYISPDFYQHPRKTPELKIPPDHYFVMGDNRDASNDSRQFGTVPKKLIYGKYLLTYQKAP
ncbi:MAG: signal peptidase I [Acidobacteriota bacterium]